jgi:hypothetical protein
MSVPTLRLILAAALGLLVGLLLHGGPYTSTVGVAYYRTNTWTGSVMFCSGASCYEAKTSP